MSKASTAHHATEAPLRFPSLPAWDGSFFDVLIHSGEAYAKACLEVQQEVLRFAGTRLKWDGQVGEALAKCKNLGDFAEVQRSWVMATAQDYFDEANRLTQLAAKCIPSYLPSTALHGAERKPEASAAE